MVGSGRRLRVHHRPQRREGRLRPRRLPRGGRRHPRPDPGRRALRRARGLARRLARLRAALDARRAEFERPEIAETDLLTINYTSGTTSRPKGVMITHRNAYMNVVGTLIHIPMTPPTATCGRCRCSTPTAGRSSGSSPRSAARTSACARSIRERVRAASRPSGSRCSAPRRPC